ncbi:MAG: peptide ABC transporter substrate-binding protein, partial [Alphaproteobacteria bacterium]|nr:peptide ABC transporter substrate-binding protein [Alphaproteobacteria bacterium]
MFLDRDPSMKKSFSRSGALALVWGLALAACWGAPTPAAAKDELVIGITQFPSTLHPAIDSMLAKNYVNGMTRRPFVVHDATWNPVCMMCVELPTVQNGGAVAETTPDGKRGIAVTFAIKPGLKWGDGTPVTSRDVQFSWEVGRHPMTGVSNHEFYRSLYKIDVKSDSVFTLHFDKFAYDYNIIGDAGLLPAHLEEKIFRADP